MPILSFLNNPKDLDPSYKTDLDLWDCFGRKKTPSYNRRNTVKSQHIIVNGYTFRGSNSGISFDSVDVNSYRKESALLRADSFL